MFLVFQAIVLGLVQGLSEFIPISSSAHLIIIPWLFHWNDPVLDSLTFDVALHIGTLLALIVFFASDWLKIIRAGVASILERKIGNDPERRMAWFLIIGSIPGGILGIMFESKIDKYFHTSPIGMVPMITMGFIIAIMGGLLLLADVLAGHKRDLKQLKMKDSVLIGLAQGLAIFPGVSRSGSTITTGLALGLKRESAAKFSFLLSAPIIAGSGIFSLFKLLKGLHSGAIPQSEILLFPIGLIAAAISGYFCIKFLLKFLQKNSVKVFVYYRWLLAILIVIVAIIRK